MTGDAGVLLQPGVQRGVVGQGGVGGRQPFGQQVGEGGMLEDGAGAAHGVAEPFGVARVGQEPEVQVRLHIDVG